MAQAAYIVCSEFRTEDAKTQAVSIFNAIDAIKLIKQEAVKQDDVASLAPGRQICVSASWFADSDDSPEDEFQYELQIHLPGSDPMTVASGSFKFDNPIAHFGSTGRLRGISTIGVMKAVGRIRKTGQEEWVEQSCKARITFA
jgi:hypothetical protein